MSNKSQKSQKTQKSRNFVHKYNMLINKPKKHENKKRKFQDKESRRELEHY